MTLSTAEIESTKNLADAIVHWLIAMEEGREQRWARRMNDATRVKVAPMTIPPPPPQVIAVAARTEPIAPRLFSTREATKYWGIGERQMWTVSAPRGPVPVVRFGRSVRHRIEDLEEFISKCRIKPWKSPGTRG